jgi:hypothetical protein
VTRELADFGRVERILTPHVVPAAWDLVRRYVFPRLRRPMPCGIVHNGNRRRVYECALCGESISYCPQWRMPRRVERFLEEHDGATHFREHSPIIGCRLPGLRALRRRR